MTGQQPPAAVAGRATGRGLDVRLARRFLAALGDPPLALVLPGGHEVKGDGTPQARLRLADRAALYRLLMDPELQFGDLFASGRIDVEGDLVALLTSVFAAMRGAPPPGRLRRLLDGLMHRRRPGTQEAARENIREHYDRGNDFFALWLDPQMQYTCAYFAEPTLSLEAAQRAKMDHVCRKLQLSPGDRVIEAGCGWGGLARHMAIHYGARVTAYNISREQVAYASARARADGTAGRVSYVEDDYRNITGTCDKFVSVGMLEHVGPPHYRELGEVIDRCLTPEGRGLIHSIGRNRPARFSAWTERRIFPGAHAPSLREMMEVFEPRDFSVLDVENLRLHYARTLEHWLARFDGAASDIEAHCGPELIRAWRLYLAGSIASFLTGQLQLFQVVFARGDDNAIPWTRAHQYAPPAAAVASR